MKVEFPVKRKTTVNSTNRKHIFKEASRDAGC
jgi:hypothetical protein